jgi:hypothetical protein
MQSTFVKILKFHAKLATCIRGGYQNKRTSRHTVQCKNHGLGFNKKASSSGRPKRQSPADQFAEFGTGVAI